MASTVGLVAVLLACCSSGFASCYFEKMLKARPTGQPDHDISLWVRNIQLSIFGLAFAFPLALSQMDSYGGDQSDSSMWFDMIFDPVTFLVNFLSGFDAMAWTVVLLQASGGLLGALVMQYADNIAKCFATSMSVVISFVVSVYLLDYQVTQMVLVGSALVLGSTWIYTAAPSRWRFPFMR